MDYKFYDTSSLLLRANDLFTKEEDIKLGFGISSITLQELENIKTSTYKSPEIKYAARHLLHLLDKYESLYDTIIYQEDFSKLTKVGDTNILDLLFDIFASKKGKMYFSLYIFSFLT